MSIDDSMVQTAVLATGGFVAAGLVGVAVWSLKRVLIDRSDDINTKVDRIDGKLDTLSQVVADMAVKNAEDHGDVIERVSKIEGQLSGLRAPWQRDKR